MNFYPPIEYGYPNLKNPPWFGLWCPLLDCFLMVHYDHILLQRLQILVMGKMLTVVTPLSEKLYLNQVIDNTCAVNWTVANPEDINFTKVLKNPICKFTVNEIIPSSIKDLDEVNRIQSWIFFVWKWLNYIDNNLTDLHHIFCAEILGQVANQKTLPIYKILLMEQDPDVAEKLIQHVLTPYE